MPDREKIIKGVACCLNDNDCGWENGDNPECPYNSDAGKGCSGKLMRDALLLITAQEEKIRSLEQTIEDICCGGQ